jgi:CMP-N-acetylneuraminic acid synthetase
MKIIAVIPARGGSKSIKNKNIYKINNKPLIFYSIENAIKSNVFDKIIVSSDSDKILSLASKYKKIEIIKRPRKISDDKSKTVDALLHVVKKLSNNNHFPEIIITLEPTSPLRSRKTIINAVNVFKLNKNIDSLISVVETKSLYGKINSGLFKYNENKIIRRRQDRNSLFKETGTIWGTKVKYLNKFKRVVGGKIYPLIINKNEDLDINNKEDIKLFKKLVK